MKSVDASLVHRLFYPGVPAVLAARSGETVAAMPVVSYVALSEKPPLFGVSCSRGSFTLKVVSEVRCFSLCLLGARHTDAIARLASTKGEEGLDKLADAGLKHHPGRRGGAPILSSSMAAVECSLQRNVRAGDHVLTVGKVESAWASADFRNYWRFRDYEPILYTGWQGGMSTYKRR